VKYNYLRSCPYSVAEKVTSPVPVFSERTQKIDSIRKKSVYNTNIFFSEFLNPYFYPKVTASEFSEVDNLRKKMEDISSLNEILLLSKSFFPNSKYYLFERIKDLSELFDEDEGCQISVDSLKSMLVFLFLIKGFAKPVLTLNENGTFQTNWKKDNFNFITLRFKEKESVDYLIFKSSRYIKKPVILNGNMNIFDFGDYLADAGDSDAAR